MTGCENSIRLHARDVYTLCCGWCGGNGCCLCDGRGRACDPVLAEIYLTQHGWRKVTLGNPQGPERWCHPDLADWNCDRHYAVRLTERERE